MKKLFKNILVSICLIVFLALPTLILASSTGDNLKFVGQNSTNAPYAAADEYRLAEIIGIIIQAFIGLLGVIFLVYMLYGGYNWMVAQGDEEKVQKAKDTIQRAVIGLIIIIASYAISFWVFDKLIGQQSIIAN